MNIREIHRKSILLASKATRPVCIFTVGIFLCFPFKKSYMYIQLAEQTFCPLTYCASVNVLDICRKPTPFKKYAFV